jgi:type IX secretion system PorP/SprF family membrane protein
MCARYLFLFSLVLVLTATREASGQQLPQYTQFALNPYLLNPAVAGTEDFIDARVGYRSQWTGFEDAPRTVYFSAHTNFSPVQTLPPGRHDTRNKLAAGVVAFQDRTGPLSQTIARLTTAYNLALSNQGLRLSVGLSGGLRTLSFDPDGFMDNLPNPNDPALQQRVSRSALNLGAGVWMYNKSAFAGISASQLFSPASDSSAGYGELGSRLTQRRHYYFMAGARLPLGRKIYLVPSALVRFVSGVPLSYNLNAKLVLSERFWGGLAYRGKESVSVFAGLLFSKRISLSYSYDLVTSQFRHAAAGSNEIHLGYRLFRNGGVECPSRFW